MKKRERKGFTIVELVIVIAVIAVLATVLVPTFGDVIERAQASAALQQVTNAYKEALIKAMAEDGRIIEGEQVTVKQFIFTFYREGADATVQVKNFSYPQVSIVDGKVLLGPESDSRPTENAPAEGEEETVLVESITLDQAKLALDVGKTGTLTATVNPANATDKSILWSTSDSAVAVVSDGVVTAVGPGTATITATAGEQTASCQVTVTYSTKANSMETLASALANGDSVSLTADISCANALTITGTNPVTIDLNGYKLTMTNTITVNEASDLSIVHGNIETTKYIQITLGGKLTIIDCMINAKGNETAIRVDGSLEIKDSTITNSKERCIIAVGSSTEPGALKLINTNVTSSAACIQVYGTSRVDVVGGTLQSTYRKSDTAAYVLEIDSTASVYFAKDSQGNLPSIISKKPTYTYSNANCLHGTVNVNGTDMTFPQQ